MGMGTVPLPAYQIKRPVISLIDAATYEKLDALDGLIARKNEVSGLCQDIRYLYLDDGEFYRCVAGFIGDESPLADANGLRLLQAEATQMGGMPLG